MRAFTPWPGTFVHWPEGRPVAFVEDLERADSRGGGAIPGEILQADKGGLVVGCGEDALRIERLQLEGGRQNDDPLNFSPATASRPGPGCRRTCL